MQTELVSIFYGDKHLRMFLAQQEQLVLAGNVWAGQTQRIYCTPSARDCISRTPSLPGVERVFDVRFLQDGSVANRSRLHLAFQDVIKRGNLAVMAQPDHVFGWGLRRAIEHLQPGDYLVCGHPRISYEYGRSRVRDFFRSGVADPDNRLLVKLFMEGVPHPMVSHGKLHAEPYWRTTRREDHWETHFKEPPPLAFIGTPDMLRAWDCAPHGNWEVVDHELPDLCFREGRLKVVTDSRVFAWAEHTSEQSYLPTLKNDIWLESCRHLDKVPLRWYFSNAELPMTTHTVSIVTPTIPQRMEQLLTRCIPSVQGQIGCPDFSGLEHVVVSDGPNERLRIALQGMSHVKLVELGRNWSAFTGGRSVGAVPRAVGCAVASGSVIGYVDDDDELLPHHVSSLIGQLIDTEADFISSQFERLYSDGRRDKIGDGTLAHGHIGTPIVLHRAECLKVCSWQSDGYAEDSALFNRWAKAGLKHTYLPEVTVKVHKQV